MNLVVVYNSGAGSAQSQVKLQQACANAAITVTEYISFDDSLAKKLAPHITQGAHIAVYGGDGTVSAVAQIVAGTAATLVPLPGGTLNHFAKDLGIAQNTETALSNLKNAKTQTVDIARINDTIFLNNSSIGLYPQSLRTRETLEPKIGKWPAAIVAFARAFFAFKIYHVTIDDTTFTTPFIFVGNNRYVFGDKGFLERERLDEGILTVFVADTTSRFGVLALGAAALFRKQHYAKRLREFQAKKLTITTQKSAISVSHDGEVSNMMTPITYKVEQKTLRVLG